MWAVKKDFKISVHECMESCHLAAARCVELWHRLPKLKIRGVCDSLCI